MFTKVKWLVALLIDAVVLEVDSAFHDTINLFVIVPLLLISLG